MDLDAVVRWCGEHHLNININKCAVMSFTCKNQKTQFNYCINGMSLPRTDVHKDLGVYFDTKLNFHQHIANVTTSGVRVLGFIIRTCKYFNNVNTIITLYKSLVVTKLQYASIIWDPQYANRIDSLEAVQRRFLKFLHYKRFLVYPPRGTDQKLLCTLFNFPCLKQLRIKVGIVFLLKLIVNKIDNKEFLGLLPFRIGRANTRSEDLFYICTPRTNLYKNSPLIRLCYCINKYCGTIDIFNVTFERFRQQIRMFLAVQ